MASQTIDRNKREFQQRLADAKVAVENCTAQYMCFNTDRRQTSAEKAHSAVLHVSEFLHQNDQPHWLSQMVSKLNFAVMQEDTDNGAIAIQEVAVKLYPLMLAHRWDDLFTDSQNISGIEIDAIYVACSRQFELQERFDEIIGLLQEIIDTREISMKMHDEMLEIIATLKHSKNGSYFATHCAMDFTSDWAKKAVWNTLGSLPILGPSIEALEEKLEETGLCLQDVSKQFFIELKEKFSSNFPELGFQPELPQLPTAPSTPPVTDTESHEECTKG